MEAKEFGKYLNEVRKEKGLTIRQIETYSGVSNSYLSQLENGKKGIPSPSILKKLSKALKVDYNSLMIKAGYLDENEKITVNETELADLMKEETVNYKGRKLSKEEIDQINKMMELLLDKRGTD